MQKHGFVFNKHQESVWKLLVQVILAKPRAEVSKKGEAYRKWLCHIQFNLSVILQPPNGTESERKLAQALFPTACSRP